VFFSAQTQLPGCLTENRVGDQEKFGATSNRRFEFHKSGQLFIRVHNETLSVAAMRVGNEDCSPARIHG
jgi:hypothetical protein